MDHGYEAIQQVPIPKDIGKFHRGAIRDTELHVRLIVPQP